MTTSREFVRSVAANLAFWQTHAGLEEPNAWSELEADRENFFRAVVFGLRSDETYPEAAELIRRSYTFIFERGYWPEWSPVLQQAIALCPEDKLTLRGQLLNQLGSLCRKQRRMEEAQDAHERAKEIGRQLGDPALIAQAQLHLGQVFLRRHQYTQAEANARKALAGFKASGAPAHKLAAAHNLLGIIAWRAGDWPSAEDQWRQACELFRRADRPFEVGRTLSNLSLALEAQADVEKALACLDEATGIFETYDMQLELARLYNILGTLHYKQGDLVAAETAFRRADTPLMRGSGPIYIRSQTEMNLANVLLAKGCFEEARAYFIKCVTGFRQVGAHGMLANSLEGLADASLELGSRQEALDLYREALAVATATPDDAFANRVEKRVRDRLQQLESPVRSED